MSNQALGLVYCLIMESVLDSCQTTFEEDGVNQQTLEDLKSTWQKRLSALHVGQFPWEPSLPPQPMPAPAPLPTATVPSNAPRTGSVSSSSILNESTPDNLRIKKEPEYGELAFEYNKNIARERAAQNLRQKFGNDAQPQIARLQGLNTMNTPPGQTVHQGAAGGQYSQANQAADKQRVDSEYARPKTQDPIRAPNLPQQPVVSNARTDGTDEWDEFVAQRRRASKDPAARHAADLSFRQQYEKIQRANEGGGLLLPLSEQPKRLKSKKCKIVASSSSASVNGSSLTPKVPQFDGIDDEDSKADTKDDLFDEDDDADAINSDLDDPDDNAIEEEQDEGRPNQIMLCTYDKVQRVKNKWRCILKDGVLNTGGKDYVFTKANGEFEW